MDSFYGVLDCLAPYVFHWAKSELVDQDQDPAADSMGNMFPDHMVNSGERCKLLTREQPMLRSADKDWRHGQHDSMNEGFKRSEEKLKRKGQQDQERGYSTAEEYPTDHTDRSAILMAQW